MNKDRLAQLIARKLALEASPEELEELELFLKDNPGDEYFLSLLTEYWSSPAFSTINDPAYEEKHFRHILEASSNQVPVVELQEHRRFSANKRLLYAAAIILLIVVSGVVAMLMKDNGTVVPVKREVVVRSGAKSRLLLPDGSTVWLNAESRISYLPNFTDSTREVDLVGEAYFDIVKSAGRPFIVHTKAINIRVLGTSFNVKCYPSEHTEATLITGMIQVLRNDGKGDSLLVLHPHEKLIVSRQDVAAGDDQPDVYKTTAPDIRNLVVRQLKKNTADTSVIETAWVYNKLVFDGQDFREVANEMERWFNVKMIFHDDAVKKYRFHARFENETVGEVLAALQLSTNFTVKINNNEINIYKK